MITPEQWEQFPNFKQYEFDSPDAPGSGREMDLDFLNILSLIRKEFGKPILINSGFRTWEHNKESGGKANSAHLRGFAVDIAIPTSNYRFELRKVALKHGITRIGTGSNFLHFDTDPTLPANVEWVY